LKKLIAAAVMAVASLALPMGLMAGPSQHSAWNFYQVDGKYDNTVLTGIDNLKKVVGYSYTGSPGGATYAITSEAPYSRIDYVSYPSATHSVAWGLNNQNLIVGHFGIASATLPYIRNKGQYGSLSEPGVEFTGVNEILCPTPNENHCHGQDNHSDQLVVGFAPVGSGFQAFEYDYANGQTTWLAPPGAVNSLATGINGKGYIVGSFETAAGKWEAFYYRYTTGEYTEFSFPGAVKTTALGLNWQSDVVGAYLDAAGKRHGFIYWTPFNKSNLVSVDEPNAVGDTVIYGINDHDQMAGDYQGADQKTHGFFAQPNPCNLGCLK
jgi:uncharacterized membrane protein